MIYYIASMAYYNMNQLDKAENSALQGLNFYYKNLDALFALTMIYDRKEDYFRTIELGTRYLALHKEIDRAEVKGNIEYKTFGSRWNVLLGLSYAYHMTERDYCALAHFEEACDEASSTAFPLEERVKFLTSIGAGSQKEGRGIKAQGSGLGN